MADYAILFAIVLAVNLLPAFGPPTWSIIAFYGLSTDLPLWSLVVVGATAAATGRLLLATLARASRGLLAETRLTNLEVLRKRLATRRGSLWLGLGLFALSPLPSGQLFVAAGLTRAPLLAFTGAFFCGRFVSYSIYSSAARGLRGSEWASALRSQFTDIGWIAMELVAVLLLVALLRLNWARLLRRRPSRGP